MPPLGQGACPEASIANDGAQADEDAGAMQRNSAPGTTCHCAWADDTVIIEAIAAISEEFEHYGWRRVRASLHQQGLIVNHKKIRRLMREHGLQPRIRRRFTATTDSNHDQPIFPNLAAGLVPDGSDQIWVADITYVAIVGGFAYVAVVLDAWSRRVIGYAISRSIDAWLTLAALNIAIEDRHRPSASITPTADRNTRLGPIGNSFRLMAWSAQWDGAATSARCPIACRLIFSVKW